jgi:hypothetical protein
MFRIDYGTDATSVSRVWCLVSRKKAISVKAVKAVSRRAAENAEKFKIKFNAKDSTFAK